MIKYIVYVTRALLWLLLVAFGYSFFSHTLIFSHHFDAKPIIIRTAEDSLLTFLTPAWEAKAIQERYYIETRIKFASMPENQYSTSMFVQTSVIDETNTTIAQEVKELWDETYTEEEDDSRLYDEVYALTERAGKHYVWITAERTLQNAEVPITLEVNVYKYRLHWWNMLLYVGIVLILHSILVNFVKK